MKKEGSLRENLNCSYMYLGIRKKVSQQKRLREVIAKNIGAMKKQRRKRFGKEENNEDIEWSFLSMGKQK